tara:strand:+ start:2716 stop:3624 length:909 start_codon:yes stop_codon:yes gene_type:complete
MRHSLALFMSCCSFITQNFAATADLELKRVLKEDNVTITEITGWINVNLDRIRFNETEQQALALRIQDRLNDVRKQYVDFLKKYPKHVNARIAYGSFLTHIDNRQGAVDQWMLALAEEPENAAALNNVATHLGTIALQTNISDGMKEAFKAMDKVLRISPKEPLYRHNQATLLCSFTKIAATHYGKSRQEIIQKAMLEYDMAIKLDPNNFEFAADRAEAFLDQRPFPYKKAISAWFKTLKLTTKQDERDWVHLQIAIAHYKAQKWGNVASALDKMSGNSHKLLSEKLRKDTSIKLSPKKINP